MIRRKKEILLLLLVGLLSVVLFFFFYWSDEIYTDSYNIAEQVYFYGNESNSSSVVYSQLVDDEYYLFLPSGTDVTNLLLHYTAPENAVVTINGNTVKTGKRINLEEISEKKDDIYTLEITCSTDTNSETSELHVMVSSGIRSCYITSEDAEKYGKDYVEATPDHSNQASGEILVLGSDGSYICAEELSTIRLRGNTTAYADKKSYKIHLKDSQDPLQTGTDGSNFALLANAYDDTLMHNMVTLKLAKEIGMDITTDCEWVDLYYDGVYCGNYLMTELPEISSNVLNIESQETKNKLVNTFLSSIDAALFQEIDMDEEDMSERVSVVNLNQFLENIGAYNLYLDTGENKYGNEIQFVGGLTEPDSVTSGYLVQMDMAYYESGISRFTTSRGLQYVIESPTYATENEVTYVSELYQALDQTAVNGGVNPDNDATIEEYLDVESFADYVAIQYLTQNGDGFYSSVYSYISPIDGLIHFGPIWDFDYTYELSDDGTEGFYMEDTYSAYVNKVPVVAQAVKDSVLEQICPAVENILFGEKKGIFLKSFAEYEAEVAASRSMNEVLYGLEDTEEQVQDFEDWIQERVAYMEMEISKWKGTAEVEEINFIIEPPYVGLAIEPVVYVQEDYGYTSILSVSCTNDGTYYEEDQHYYYEVVLTAGYGCSFAEDMHISMGIGGVADITFNEDRTEATVLIDVGEATVKNTIYDHTDYEEVYDKDYYLEHYPYVAKTVGTDDEDVLVYFLTVGIRKGEVASADFSVKLFCENCPDIAEEFDYDYYDIMNWYVHGGYIYGQWGKVEE